MQVVRSGVWTPIPAPKLTRLERTTTMTSMQSNESYGYVQNPAPVGMVVAHD